MVDFNNPWAQPKSQYMTPVQPQAPINYTPVPAADKKELNYTPVPNTPVFREPAPVQYQSALVAKGGAILTSKPVATAVNIATAPISGLKGLASLAKPVEDKGDIASLEREEARKRAVALIVPPITLINKEYRDAAMRGSSNIPAPFVKPFQPAPEDGSPKVEFRLPGTKSTSAVNVVGQFLTPQTPAELALTVGSPLLARGIGYGAGKVAFGATKYVGAPLASALPKTTAFTVKTVTAPTTRALAKFGTSVVKGLTYPSIATAYKSGGASDVVKEQLKAPEQTTFYQSGMTAISESLAGLPAYDATITSSLSGKQGWTPEDIDTAKAIAKNDMTDKNWVEKSTQLSQEQKDYITEIRNKPGFTDAVSAAKTAMKQSESGLLPKFAYGINIALSGKNEEFLKGVEKSARDFYSKQGLTGEELNRKVKIASNAAMLEFGSRAVGQAAGAADISRGSEIVGGVGVAKAFEKFGGKFIPYSEVGRNIAKTAGRFAIAGAGEGAGMYLLEKSAKKEKAELGGLALYTGVGAVSAATGGTLIAGLDIKGAGAMPVKKYLQSIKRENFKGAMSLIKGTTPEAKKIVSKSAGKATLGVAYVLDPFEAIGDKFASFTKSRFAAGYGRTSIEPGVILGTSKGVEGVRLVSMGGTRIKPRTTTFTSTISGKPSSVMQDIKVPTNVEDVAEKAALERMPADFYKSPVGTPSKQSTPVDINQKIQSLIKSPMPSTVPAPTTTPTPTITNIFTSTDITTKTDNILPVTTTTTTPTSTTTGVTTPTAVTIAIPGMWPSLGMLGGGQAGAGRGGMLVGGARSNYLRNLFFEKYKPENVKQDRFITAQKRGRISVEQTAQAVNSDDIMRKINKITEGRTRPIVSNTTPFPDKFKQMVKRKKKK